MWCLLPQLTVRKATPIAYFLPNPRGDVIQLSGQRVDFQGPFKLPLVLEQVALEIPPPGQWVG